MTFTNLLTDKVVIGRLVVVSGDKTAYATVTTEYVSIQRLAETKSVEYSHIPGKKYRLYAEETADIQKDDWLKDEDGNEYKVIDVNIPASIGNFVHKEAVLIRVK